MHFPFVCAIDPRGVHVTLSHYCPTAARMLFDETAAPTVVEGRPSPPTCRRAWMRGRRCRRPQMAQMAQMPQMPQMAQMAEGAEGVEGVEGGLGHWGSARV
ncbi:MAG: hypothetical protein R2712_25640 [Vicinamibacterales bacterium]